MSYQIVEGVSPLMEHDLQLFFAALPSWKAAILVVVLPTAIAMFGPVLAPPSTAADRR
jgi:hypothetical protein